MGCQVIYYKAVFRVACNEGGRGEADEEEERHRLLEHLLNPLTLLLGRGSGTKVEFCVTTGCIKGLVVYGTLCTETRAQKGAEDGEQEGR